MHAVQVCRCAAYCAARFCVTKHNTLNMLTVLICLLFGQRSNAVVVDSGPANRVPLAETPALTNQRAEGEVLGAARDRPTCSAYLVNGQDTTHRLLCSNGSVHGLFDRVAHSCKDTVLDTDTWNRWCYYSHTPTCTMIRTCTSATSCVVVLHCSPSLSSPH